MEKIQGALWAHFPSHFPWFTTPSHTHLLNVPQSCRVCPAPKGFCINYCLCLESFTGLTPFPPSSLCSNRTFKETYPITLSKRTTHSHPPAPPSLITLLFLPLHAPSNILHNMLITSCVPTPNCIPVSLQNISIHRGGNFFVH